MFLTSRSSENNYCSAWRVVFLKSSHEWRSRSAVSSSKKRHIKKALIIFRSSMLLISVGVTGIEPATSRPPDAHSNRTELHPEIACKSRYFILSPQGVMGEIFIFPGKYLAREW